MDLSSPTAMVDYYEALEKVQSELEATGDTSSAAYSEITEELESMKEQYDEAKI